MPHAHISSQYGIWYPYPGMTIIIVIIAIVIITDNNNNNFVARITKLNYNNN